VFTPQTGQRLPVLATAAPADGPAPPAEGVRRRALTDTATGLPLAEEPLRPLTLKGLPVALIDRVLPPEPKRFLLVVGGIVLLTWGLGYVLAADRAKFLWSPEWRAGPLFLAVHFVALRLFVTLYARNFLRGTAHLEIPPGEAERRMVRVLRPVGGVAAVLLAVPFCVFDFNYLSSAEYQPDLALGPGGTLGPADYLLWGTWCLEWILNAYIWVLLVGFLWLSMWALRWYPFRAPVELVLHEKQYRPFLLMSVQGASVLLFLGMANVAYVWYAEGELSDYVGLGITGGLLLLGFVPPWYKLKAKVEEMVGKETFRLRAQLVDRARPQLPAATAPPGHPLDLHQLAVRIDDALAMLRIDYLERLHQELGRSEGRAIILRMLAPATSILWPLFRPF
jgi:hypothetical protein